MNADKAVDLNEWWRAGAAGGEATSARNRRTDDATPLAPKRYCCWLVRKQLDAWLVRDETCLQSWLALHRLAFASRLLRKMLARLLPK